VVTEVAAELRRMLFGTALLSEFKQRLALEDVVIFKEAIPLAPLVDRLEFVSNKKYWGTALKTSPRYISVEDYVTITAGNERTKKKQEKNA